MIDEGYTKFDVRWTRSEPLAVPEIDELIRCRSPLYQAGLIGEYEELGVGYGNISHRCSDSDRFVISGTQTGHLPELRAEHFAMVTTYDIDDNSVACTGPVQASSESMTHATIYSLCSTIHAVVHIHSREMWVRLKDQIATTAADVAYGTPEMAREFQRIYRDTDFATAGVAVMAGHDEGLVSIGRNLQEATSRVLLLSNS